MKTQTTLDKWNTTVECQTLEERAKNDSQLADILSWEAVEMRDWI